MCPNERRTEVGSLDSHLVDSLALTSDRLTLFMLAAGHEGKPAASALPQSFPRAVRFYRMAAELELEEDAAAEAAAEAAAAGGPGGGDAHNPEAVPTPEGFDDGPPAVRPRSWQGAYSAAYMKEDDPKVSVWSAMGAYVDVAVRARMAPRPTVAVAMALQRCAAKAVARLPLVDTVANVARRVRRAALGV